MIKKILFICIHNSARSQMAEAFANHFAPDRIDARSAGLEPGELNPLVVEAMAEVKIDISRNQTKSAFDLWKNGALFDYVIAVCDAEAAEKCPIFPGVTKRLHWPFPDPSKVEGTRDEKLRQVREIRDAIAAKVREFIATMS
ncbi:MAG: arsenate reductase ArsC [Spartobacteria bacterium]